MNLFYLCFGGYFILPGFVFLYFLIDSGTTSAITFSNIASSSGSLLFTSRTPDRLSYPRLHLSSPHFPVFICLSLCAAFWVIAVDKPPRLLIPSSLMSNLLSSGGFFNWTKKHCYF